MLTKNQLIKLKKLLKDLYEYFKMKDQMNAIHHNVIDPTYATTTLMIEHYLSIIDKEIQEFEELKERKRWWLIHFIIDRQKKEERKKEKKREKVLKPSYTLKQRLKGVFGLRELLRIKRNKS